MRIYHGICQTLFLCSSALMFFKRDCMVVGHKYCHFLCFCPRNLIDSGNTVITGQNCIHTIFFRLL